MKGEFERIVVRRAAAGVAPETPAELFAWLRVVLDVDVPRTAALEGSDAPFEYLCWAFFEGRGIRPPQQGGRGQQQPHTRPAPKTAGSGTNRAPLRGGEDGSGESGIWRKSALAPAGRENPDCVVWAPRGGGKTFYAAVATALDLVFKDGIEVKVLAGSLEQAQRMHAHLRRLFDRPELARLVDGRITERRLRLMNGSWAEVLAASQASVRGTRPQKLRCDEVELFDEEVWQAAQLVTRSKVCGPAGRRARVRGSVEALSTCHRPGGLMARLIGQGSGRVRFRWTAVDVLEACPAWRRCGECVLWDECRGRAKRARSPAGHLFIDDACAMKGRADRATWEAEMLCLRPMRRTAVFPEFDPAVHVAEFNPPDPPDSPEGVRWVAGMDFGMRSPTVILWGCVDETGVLRIVAERVESGAAMEAHIEAIKGGMRVQGTTMPIPRWIGVDPAGCQRSAASAVSPVAALRRAGLVVRYRRVALEEGLRTVRRRLAPASGPPTLIIHARCVRLIECMRNYRYPDDPRAASPLKDGHDHAADALRYLVVNLDQGERSACARYV